MAVGATGVALDEPEAWSGDFSYGYLERFFELASAFLTPATLGEATAEDVGRIFVRHDVDVSLSRAVSLARHERRWTIPATYHVMLDSPFYDVGSTPSRDALAELADLGHEVGLHYNVDARMMRTASAEAREADMVQACEELERFTGQAVRSLSFHLPMPELMGGPLRVAGRVSGYANELFAWYLSDSRGRWREGEPVAGLVRPRGPNLQILIHPVWWGEQHAAPPARLHELLTELEPALGRNYAVLNDELWEHIIRRAEAPNR